MGDKETKSVLTFLWFHFSNFLQPHLPGLTVTGLVGFTLALPAFKQPKINQSINEVKSLLLLDKQNKTCRTSGKAVKEI